MSKSTSNTKNGHLFRLVKLNLGTPGYMSPQIVVKTPYTSKCDIWSLGVIYYEMLFGTLPGRGSDEFLMAMDIK